MRHVWLLLLSLSACGVPFVAGVPYYEDRPLAPGELEAVARVIEASPNAPWDDVYIVFMPELPGPPPKPGGLTYPGPPPVRIKLDPRDAACVLMHQMIEHAQPGLRGDGWNRYHTRPELTKYSIRLQQLADCKRRDAGDP